jgi:hypothetical protein
MLIADGRPMGRHLLLLRKPRSVKSLALGSSMETAFLNSEDSSASILPTAV